MLSFLFVTYALSQQDCSLTNWQPCLDLATQYQESTCLPLASKNATFYNDCLCYSYINEGYCYAQCPGNSIVQTELTTVIQPKIDAQCAAQGINPLSPPQPPVWQSYFPSDGSVPSSFPGEPTSSDPGSSNPSLPTNAQNAASGIDVTWVWLMFFQL